jgi:hypothetical protein
MWTHDDLVTDSRVVAAWLAHDATHCVVVAVGNAAAEVLPPVSEWAGFWWVWLPKLISEGEAMLASGIKCPARLGAPLTDGHVRRGYSDAFFVRTQCEESNAFAAALVSLRRAGMYLEIAVHTAAHCAASNATLLGWREFTTFTERRLDPLAYLEASHAPDPPPILHPLKLSDAVAVAVTLELRDRAWAARA